ncbi:ATP-dependent helicase HrpA [Luteimicrobium subarcticum]|uniref:ATP-dependent helicase HrpA n=1 Tax=Luteimicrobium subarcticum TaxID=620910 RepID=A0A2M8WJ89_9MICO|nr:ATP-dependent helicase HrpA [Luteimicrobium subarcticum]
MSDAHLTRMRERREAVELGTIRYPEQLPVSAHRDEIAAAIRDHQVVIVAGETGSGKTTQLPKILLDLGRGRAGQIAHTQPRRIAARSVAERVAEELGSPLGEVVGYQVRFTDESSDSTLVKVMTDGILLAAIQRDPQLLAYDTIVVDEAHERSLNIDFLLGYLSRLLPQRPDLKLVITSATIDSARFARHFGTPAPAGVAAVAAADTAGAAADDVVPAPVIEVSGRTFPVEIRYRPLVADAETPDDGAPGGARAGKGGKGPAPKKPREDRDLVTGIVDAVDELIALDRTRRDPGPGDILVFLSGEREIRDAADALTGHFGERGRDPRDPGYVEVLPLFARLSAAEQHRVFAAHAGRRIVLATNVAETSLTVPGIRYVVDPGTARISRYSKATKVQRLPIEPVSQASANQRSGRCGRLSDGVAIRLYSEDDFAAREPFTEPEILRTSLASVILQMISVGVVGSPDDVARFPFVDQPDTRAIRDGVQLLTELGALEQVHDDGASRTRLTETGRQLAQLPMDPRLARMIVEGSRRGVAREVTIVAAALSIQDPRERPTEERAQADQMHARFADPTSDFLSYLNLWRYVRELQRDLSGNQFRRRVRSEHLNFLRIREWQDLVSQLRDTSKPLGIRWGSSAHAQDHREAAGGPGDAKAVAGLAGGARGTRAPDGRPSTPGSPAADPTTDPHDEHTTDPHRHAWDADTIHQALLSGLLSQVGMQQTADIKASARQGRDQGQLKRMARQARNEYLGARGIRFAVFPGSPLSKKPPAWVMAGELVETSRLWARDVARIQPEWVEEVGAHLVKRTYSEPTWSSRRGAATVVEKVLLYGVPVVADRQVLYAKVDAEAAREMFVRHALVEGQWSTHHAFWKQNRTVLDEAEELEARSRQRGLVVDDDVLFAFYDARVPASVVSARHFDQWWKTARRRTPDLLDLTLDLLVPQAGEIDTTQFPESWPQSDLTLPLTYQFSPGTDADGVTVHVPVSVLARVTPDGFDWMVPGLLDELTTATIRSLPKPVRVQLVPAPDAGRDVADWLRANTPTWADMARAGDMAEPFRAAFTRAVRAVRGVDIPDDAWAGQAARLPAHLRMTFRVVSEPERGVAQVLGEDKDLLGLQRKLAGRAEAAVRTAVRAALEAARASAGVDTVAGAQARLAPPSSERSGSASAGAPSEGLPGRLVAEVGVLDGWPPVDVLGGDAGRSLPDVVETRVGAGAVVRGYPGLVVEPGAKGGDVVALRVHADRDRRDAEHADGVRTLLLREVALPVGRVTSRWTGTQALTLASSPYRTTDALVDDVQRAAVRSLTSGPTAVHPDAPDAGAVRDLAAFDAARGFVREHLEDEVHRVVGHVVAALSAARTLDGEIRATSSLALLNTLTDLREQQAALVPAGFVSRTPAHRLPHLTRYLRAASARLDKARSNPHRDAELAWHVHDVEQAYERARAAYTAGRRDPARAAELADVRWQIEELRVSLFAQQLGTDGPVSEKRIRKALDPSGW